MDEQVQDFIRLKKEALEQKKSAQLIAWGLYDKVYAKSDGFSNLFPEVDTSTNPPRRYKCVPLPVSDEEYRELCALMEQVPDERPNEYQIDPRYEEPWNKIGLVTRVAAIIVYIVGFFVGIALAVPERSADDFSWSVAMVFWLSALVFGTLLLGISEMIHLLNNKQMTVKQVKKK